jgi:hypothetical protein
MRAALIQVALAVTRARQQRRRNRVDAYRFAVHDGGRRVAVRNATIVTRRCDVLVRRPEGLFHVVPPLSEPALL